MMMSINTRATDKISRQAIMAVNFIKSILEINIGERMRWRQITIFSTCFTATEVSHWQLELMPAKDRRQNEEMRPCCYADWTQATDWKGLTLPEASVLCTDIRNSSSSHNYVKFLL